MLFHQIQLMACAVIAQAYAKRAQSTSEAATADRPLSQLR
jgi:predicted Na+-dependent transporter